MALMRQKVRVKAMIQLLVSPDLLLSRVLNPALETLHTDPAQPATYVS